ncbi:DUF2997 domain-containing protein [Planctomicrobium sp. SH527]|uniref:DUF2997 domain-containing protein n=1 Tax=Planctomicrobium sp. SH527 TaxID=3448123 RepID=UPI003F5BEED7
MSQRELEIEIAPDGKVTVRTIGIKGKECLDVAQALIQGIGTEEHREMTTEFYESEHDVTQHQNLHDRYQ